MSCQNYENCHKDELDTLQYPIDTESIYANRYYDDQTARARCYADKPIEIVEGFGGGYLTWTNLIKLIVVILLIYLAYSLSQDFFAPKQVITLGIQSPSTFQVSQPSIVNK